MRGLRFFSVGAAAFLLVLCALAWAGASLVVQPRSVAISHPADWPADDVTIVTDDGVRLAGWYSAGVAPRSPGVLLLHGNGSSRLMFRTRQRLLREAGYAVLAIDLRGHGASAPRTRSLGLFEARDAHAAYRWLRQKQQGAPIGVIGVSLGGASALLGEDGPLAADALVLEAVYPDIRRAIRNRIASRLGAGALLVEPFVSFQSIPLYGVLPDALSPLAAVERYRGPLLVVGGAADVYTPAAETRAIFDAAPGPKTLMMARDADHRGIGGLDSDDYRRTLLAFLERWLGPAEPSLARGA